MDKKYSIKDRKRFEVVNLLISGAITEKGSGEELALSDRQIRRLKRRFLDSGQTIDSLVFNRIHPQVNKVPDTIREKVVVLKREGSHRSCQHICELLPSVLTKEEKSWFIRWGKAHYHLSRAVRKSI